MRQGYPFRNKSHRLFVAFEDTKLIRSRVSVTGPLKPSDPVPRICRGHMFVSSVVNRGGTAGRSPVAAPAPSPLSHAQEALLFWDRMAPETAVYNVPLAYEVAGKLNWPALERSLNLILTRHKVLRSTFHLEEDRPAFSVCHDAGVEVKCIDLRGGAADDPSIRNAVEIEARRPFKLAQDVMLRCAVFRCSGEKHILLFTLHHIASDGWSLGVMLTELLEAYSALHRGVCPELGELPWQYSDYAAWSRQRLQGVELEKLAGFWREDLRGAEWCELLPRKRRGVCPGFSGETVSRALAAETVEVLSRVGQASDATLFMVMLAGLLTLLHGTSGCEDLTVGVAVANRARLEFWDLMGCFVNTIPVRIRLSGGMTFEELLRSTRETFLRAFAHQELPFSELVRDLQPRRIPGASPFFQVQLLYQSYPFPEFRTAELTGAPFDVDTGTAKFDLSVIVEKQQKLKVAFEYNTAFWKREEMTRLLDVYVAILRDAARNAQHSVLRICSEHPSGSETTQ